MGKNQTNSIRVKALAITLIFLPTGMWLQASANSDETIIISQKNRTYAPGAISVQAGETIRIINDDIFLHHAFVEDESMEYDSGPMEEGETRDIEFREPGQYNVKCAIHPKMNLTVKVE